MSDSYCYAESTVKESLTVGLGKVLAICEQNGYAVMPVKPTAEIMKYVCNCEWVENIPVLESYKAMLSAIKEYEMKVISFGVVIILTGLWLGMYVLHICPIWAELPTLLTMLSAFAVGAIFVNAGINNEQ